VGFTGSHPRINRVC